MGYKRKKSKMQNESQKDRKPSSVLGWLTTSANYTVVAASAPAEYRPGDRQADHAPTTTKTETEKHSGTAG